MTARRVVCPGCKTTLQLPATMAQGNVKCPKCAMILAIRPPANQTQPIQPASVRPVAAASRPPADLFAELGNVGSPATPGNQRFGFPPAAAQPAGTLPRYQTQPRSPAPKRKKTGGSGGKTALKVLGILGGVGFFCVLLCAGGLFTIGLLSGRHSGWTPETFHGYTINMPAGKDRQRKSQQQPHTTIHELAARRKESGSQYSLVVAKMPSGSNMSISELVQGMRMKMSNQQPVTRAGVTGISGTIISGIGAVKGSQTEIFLHNGNLVVATYSPYSQIKDLIGGKMSPRKNERELDKPAEFFSSISFQ